MCLFSYEATFFVFCVLKWDNHLTANLKHFSYRDPFLVILFGGIKTLRFILKLSTLSTLDRPLSSSHFLLSIVLAHIIIIN